VPVAFPRTAASRHSVYPESSDEGDLPSLSSAGFPTGHMDDQPRCRRFEVALHFSGYGVTQARGLLPGSTLYARSLRQRFLLEASRRPETVIGAVRQRETHRLRRTLLDLLDFGVAAYEHFFG
jgi:hypothetical protein